MSLAQRVRDFRYSKGWGPDELANRAEISRTALYQIESGKTGLPRAGTLRRIAVALEVPMEDLLGHEERNRVDSAGCRSGRVCRSRSPGLYDWVPSEGGPLAMPAVGNFRALSPTASDDLRFTIEARLRAKTNGHDVDLRPRGRTDVEASRPASFSDRRECRTDRRGAAHVCFPGRVLWSDSRIPRMPSILSGRFPQGTAS